MRLTAAQALVRFLAAQVVERDGRRRSFFGGCFGIFGHGNVAGIGQALHERPDLLRYIPARNEQGMVHAAVGYARQLNRLGAFVCTSSIGPGATNMITGAALATVNRLPVLLVPGDVFAGRLPDPVLQQLESSARGDVSVNDCFIPVSRYFDRIERPEQVIPAAIAAMRVLTSPAETGAVTLAFPQDVQAEAFEVPEEFLAERVWHVPRAVPDETALAAAVAAIRSARRPLVVAGGGVVYSEATDALRRFCEATGIPVGETQAGKGSLPYDHPSCLGAIGATGTFAANRVAAEADLVLGIGTRFSDFTTASKTAFRNPGVRFVNVNVAEHDAAKHGGVALVGDARATLERLSELLGGHAVDAGYRETATRLAREWDDEVTRLYSVAQDPPAQSAVIGAVNAAARPADVVVCAAGSMPGDLHKLWRARDPKGYHVEYGYSCMGYEIAGGLGAKLAAPEREVFVLVGDGSYLMLPGELVTAVQEGAKLTIVLVDNRGYASIGALSRSLGTEGFGTELTVDVDLAANAASLGAHVVCAATVDELRAALAAAKAETRTTVIVVPTEREADGVPSYESWWDVPVAEVSETESVRAARSEYERARALERRLV
ncbi:MAG TPA: 3D-(3,5/4)-trihydroxycyclohexane-1,2-dione acylhydrolase (decyclizing) [Gaiellaceae bacterium]|nr:3D-(3,5/4)-trihydroxycyclohexane-1,2-dione acylhydrolase (decyclizing) [Gaiellaceae bacterium]